MTTDVVAQASQPDVTLDDFMTGLLAGLAADGVRVVSIRTRVFYEAVLRTFQQLEARHQRDGLRLRFWIALNRIHGDSADVREAITKAVQRDLISLDNPVYLDMRLKISAQDAQAYLDELPGSPDLYRDLARVFRESYQEQD